MSTRKPTVYDVKAIEQDRLYGERTARYRSHYDFYHRENKSSTINNLILTLEEIVSISKLSRKAYAVKYRLVDHMQYYRGYDGRIARYSKANAMSVARRVLSELLIGKPYYVYQLLCWTKVNEKVLKTVPHPSKKAQSKNPKSSMYTYILWMCENRDDSYARITAELAKVKIEIKFEDVSMLIRNKLDADREDDFYDSSVIYPRTINKTEGNKTYNVIIVPVKDGYGSLHAGGLLAICNGQVIPLTRPIGLIFVDYVRANSTFNRTDAEVFTNIIAEAMHIEAFGTTADLAIASK